MQNPNLLLSVQYAYDHMCAFAPHVHINWQKLPILAVKDTVQGAEGSHKYLKQSWKVSTPLGSIFTNSSFLVHMLVVLFQGAQGVSGLRLES